MSVVDADSLRETLGLFATGVCVVTGLDTAGKPVGMTVNSFNSVSLDPPLVLWSVGQHAPEYEAFCQAGAYIIHFLNEHQAALSNHFATPAQDKFSAEVEMRVSVDGIPVLKDVMGCLHCVARHSYPAGDHNILVGQVVKIDRQETGKTELPLLYHASQYRRIGACINQ